MKNRDAWIGIVLAALTFAALAVLGDRSVQTLAGSAVAAAAAGAAFPLAGRRPVVAFLLLLVLTTLSGPVLALPLGRVRLEQPAILVILARIAIGRLWPRWVAVRRVLPVAAACAIYMLVLTLSSLLNAPQFAVSARMIVWTALSMTGGAVAFLLLARRPTATPLGWLTVTGLGHAGLAIMIGIWFLVLGPDGVPGMQVNHGEAPKVSGLAFEANLFASTIGALAPFAVERFRQTRDRASAASVVVILLGLGLGVTRGAYAGVAAGAVVYLGLLAYRSRNLVEVRRLAPILVVPLLMAPLASATLLPNERHPWTLPGGTAFASPSPAVTAEPGHSALPTPIPTPTPPPTPEPTMTTNTAEFRLERIPAAVAEIRTSPIIGLGAASFGQRHALVGNVAGIPDYIAILALSVVYETGLLGAGALAVGFLLAFLLLFRASRRSAGEAAAFSAALVSLLVAYQVTSAIFASFIWVILGAALAFAVRPDESAIPSQS